MRRLKRPLICAVLGLVTTIAVAWASCLFEKPGKQWGARYVWTSNGCANLDLTGLIGHDRVMVWKTGVITNVYGGVVELAAIGVTDGARWSRVGLDLQQVSMQRAGWPLRCLESSCEISMQSFGSNTRGEPRPSWCVRVRPAGTAVTCDQTLDGTVPLRPVALPFLANSILFATSWWILALIASLVPRSAVRAARRRRYNQCVRCGYSLAGLAPNAPCPECGHASP